MLKVWYAFRHDDHDVFEKPYDRIETAMNDISLWKAIGGVWIDGFSGQAHRFIPWHSISGIEYTPN
jgi:hypothetical protein